MVLCRLAIDMGKTITEAISFKTYSVNDVKITYIGFSLESVVVIEYKDEVLVNINDALNSNHENAVDFILNEIEKRCPKITYLLSGWSGASYFPNQIRYPGKDDVEIGKLREQYFANNFCRFVNILQPKYAIPFASGFVLLKEENKWINHIKFPRGKVFEYYKEHFKESNYSKFIVPYPGDIIKDGEIEINSELRKEYNEMLKEYNLNLHFDRTAKENKVEITLKLNTVEVAAIVAAFERYEYHVKAIYNDAEYSEERCGYD